MISLVLVSTSVWPRTARVVWSIAASRCTCGLAWWPLPRRVLPSTATARRPARCRRRPGGGGGCWPASQRRWPGPARQGRRGPARGARSPRRVAARRRSTGGGAPRARPAPAGRVSGPLADRGQGPGAGQHRAGRHGQHRAQRMPSAAPLSWVGELGEVVEQAAALGGCQRGGRGRRWAAAGMGDDGGAGTAVRSGHGLRHPHDRREPCLLHIQPAHSPDITNQSNPHYAEALGIGW